MVIADFILGCVLLLAGRKLFWVCIGVLGFVLGMQAALTWGTDLAPALVLGLAILLGIIGAVLAVTFEWVMVVFGVGFLGGGYLATALAPYVMTGYQEFYMVIFIVGGIIGAALTAIVFDWALIIITSLIGATLILQGLGNTYQPWHAAIFAAALLIGIMAQFMALEKSPQPDTRRETTS